MKKKLLCIIRWLHLWPSIVSGIILVFVCLAGVLIVYSEEILDLSAGKELYIHENEIPSHKISSKELIETVRRAYPDHSISSYVFYKDPKRTLRIRTWDEKNEKLNLIYVNPYNGKIQKVDSTAHVFFVLAHLHASLLAGRVGAWVVAISTIIFTISCLTGIVLWWPKRWTKASRKSSFTVKWKAKWKRLNYDLHNVFGFYALLLCVILSISGLLIFFPSLMKVTVHLTGGDASVNLRKILPTEESNEESKDFILIADHLLKNEFKNKNAVTLSSSRRMKTSAYLFVGGDPALKSYRNYDLVAYNRYTGKQIPLPAKVKTNQKIQNIVWQLHLGNWLGTFGKTITFFIGLVATSLPITGFIVWWGKQSKKNKRKKSKHHKHKSK